MAHDHSHGSRSRRQLAIVFAIVTTIFVFQLIGSVVTGSLALLIDTGHNAVDLIGIGIALFAATLVHKPASGQKTWGFRRAEVLAAGAQATLLLGLGVYSLIEGIRRFLDRKSTRLNSSHVAISYAVFCLKKKKHVHAPTPSTRETAYRQYSERSNPL